MSITVNAVDLLEYTYKKYFHDTYYDKYYIAISKEQFGTDSTSTGDSLYDLRTGLDIEISQIQDWYTVSNTAEAYLCVYTISGWELSLGYGKAGSSPYVKYIAPIAYELTTVPDNFPILDLTTAEELEIQFQQEIQQLKQDLNATTATSAEANRMQSVITEKIEQYENGEIKNYELQNAIDLTSGYLDELSQNTSNTIADKIAINNAQNTVLLAQEKLNVSRIDGRLSQILREYQDEHEVSDTLRENLSVINSLEELQLFIGTATSEVLVQLEDSVIDRSEAIIEMSKLNHIITYIMTLDEITEKDTNVLNSLSNNINNSISALENYGDLEQDVATKSQNSDQEEIELLNQMVSVMQDQTVENKLQDQQIAGSAENINSILDPVWNNKFFTYLIGTSGVLIIACILLHTRYRML